MVINFDSKKAQPCIHNAVRKIYRGGSGTWVRNSTGTPAGPSSDTVGNGRPPMSLFLREHVLAHKPDASRILKSSSSARMVGTDYRMRLPRKTSYAMGMTRDRRQTNTHIHAQVSTKQPISAARAEAMRQASPPNHPARVGRNN